MIAISNRKHPDTTPCAHTPATAVPDRPERLGPDDDLFVRMECVLELPVVNQVVWRLPKRMTREHFTALGQSLAAGRLSRLVKRTPFPLRDRWIHTPSAGIFQFHDGEIPMSEVASWARAQAEAAAVDCVNGPAWQLTATGITETGGTAVSWVSSHVIGDGGAVVTGVQEVLQGRQFDTHNPDGGLIDAVGEGISSLAASTQAAARLVRGTSGSPPTRPPAPAVSTWAPASTPPGADGRPTTSPTVIVGVDAEQFDCVAAEVGGTANTLFTAIVIGVLQRSGRVADGDVIPVGLPVSTRTPDDRRANATIGATARYPINRERYRDLTSLRAESKSAYTAASAGPGKLALLGIFAQPLGDRIVRRLAANSRAPLCLASNLGRLSDDFASLGTGAVGEVAMRSVTLGASPETLRRMDGGISGWSSRSAGVVTLCVTALDPDRVPTDQRLTELVLEELNQWQLRFSVWGHDNG